MVSLLLEKILRQKSSIFVSDAVVAILELGSNLCVQVGHTEEKNLAGDAEES